MSAGLEIGRGEGDGPARLAVLADVHGNAHACREALRLVRRRGFDQLLVLGDLLTYGCEPLAVLDLVGDAVERDAAVVVLGNHDQLYIDLARGVSTYYDTLPVWLREAADWTADALAGADLAGMFPWRRRHVAAGVLLAHANPFAYGDWTYLDTPQELARAALALREGGGRVGVFGHTHRAKIAVIDALGEVRVTPCEGTEARTSVPASGPAAIVADPGSVGQPRDRAKVSTVLFVSRLEAEIRLEHTRVRYDVEAHKRSIVHASLSPATRGKLLTYLP